MNIHSYSAVVTKVQIVNSFSRRSYGNGMCSQGNMCCQVGGFFGIH